MEVALIFITDFEVMTDRLKDEIVEMFYYRKRAIDLQNILQYSAVACLYDMPLKAKKAKIF